MNPLDREWCRSCGHAAHQPRALCTCATCENDRLFARFRDVRTYGVAAKVDVLPTTAPTLDQSVCAATGHGPRDGCHCDGGGYVCRVCGFHGHYGPRS